MQNITPLIIIHVHETTIYPSKNVLLSNDRTLIKLQNKISFHLTGKMYVVQTFSRKSEATLHLCHFIIVGRLQN